MLCREEVHLERRISLELVARPPQALVFLLPAGNSRLGGIYFFPGIELDARPGLGPVPEMAPPTQWTRKAEHHHGVEPPDDV